MTNDKLILTEIRQIGIALTQAPFNEDTIDLLHDATIILWELKQLMEDDILGEREGTSIPTPVLDEAKKSIALFLNK